MKAFEIKGFGEANVLQYKPNFQKPIAKEGEAVVKNTFIGINYVDVYWRQGFMGKPPNGILGREAEGVVESIGPGTNTNIQVGDRVVWLSMGAYAEYTAVPTSLIYIVPTHIQDSLAASSLLQGLTAMALTESVLQVQKDDWVLVHAAAGGVGLWLCQLLKLAGAKVIGTASTQEKMDIAQDYGADFVINYKQEVDLVGKIREITKAKMVNIVYDSVGKDQTENNVKVVSDGGTIVTYGMASGIPGSLPYNELSKRRIRFVGPGETSLMRHVGGERFQTWCRRLFDSISKHNLRVKVHKTYAFESLVQAHRDIESRQTVGKLLVKL